MKVRWNPLTKTIQEQEKKTWTGSKDPCLLLFCQKCILLPKPKTKIKDVSYGK